MNMLGIIGKPPWFYFFYPGNLGSIIIWWFNTVDGGFAYCLLGKEEKQKVGLRHFKTCRNGNNLSN